MTNIILLERIPFLGKMGDVVSVKPGYARNYLLPKGKALRATQVNVELFSKKKLELEATNLSKRRDAEAVFSKLDQFEMTLIRPASEVGQLYGSVRNKDVSDELEVNGFKIQKSQIIIQKPIKTLGHHEVFVILHPEVKATIKITIAKSKEEAAANFDEADVIALIQPEEISERD
jgi:large subunit ribosomal protein L9